METTTLITLIITIVLAIERVISKTKKCHSKCCGSEVDIELQSPKGDNPKQEEPTIVSSSALSDTEPNVV
jgi:hypothetical protein